MFRLIKKVFIGLLTGIVSAFNHTKCFSLSNQKCKIQPTLNGRNLHPTEYSQEFHFYPFAVKLDMWLWSCNTLNNLSNKVCIPNKTEDLNLSVFIMITSINELKTLTKFFHANANVDLMEKKCQSNQWWNNDKCWFECKKHHICKKIMFGILLCVIVKIKNT